MKIINRFTGNIIFEHESDNLKIVVEAAVSLKVSLRSANLGYADLRYADLDFTSGLNFSCKTFGIKADMRLAAQIAYHFCRIDFGDCDDAKKAQSDIRLLANKFHRVAECGKIEEPK